VALKHDPSARTIFQSGGDIVAQTIMPPLVGQFAEMKHFAVKINGLVKIIDD